MSADPQVIANNLMEFGPILQTVSIMMGLGLIVSGFFSLKRYGEMRTMMSNQMSVHTPVMLLLAGIMFLILPTAISTFLTSFWGNANPLSYNGGSGWAGIDQYVPDVLIFVRIIGVGAFMRGIILMARAAHTSGQPGTISKCLLHLLGGILCVHIVYVVDLLKSILDLT